MRKEVSETAMEAPGEVIWYVMMSNALFLVSKREYQGEEVLKRNLDLYQEMGT